ncbi:MAG: hypothetical protein WCW31_01615 [Patescibacteria group bacterium]|jgi:endonuclease-3 related protein
MTLQTIFRRKIEQLFKQYGRQGWWPRLISQHVTYNSKLKSIKSYKLSPPQQDPATYTSIEAGQVLSYKIKHSPGPKNGWHLRGKVLEVWEVGIGAILTQNTSWSNVEKALLNMAQAGVLTPQEIIKSRRLESLIRPVGYYKQKAKKLKILARFFVEHPSVILNEAWRSEGYPLSDTVEILRKAQNDEVIGLRQQLLSLWGVGPETADTILLYGFGLPIFVVDAYTRRLLVQLSDDQSWLTRPYDEVRGFCESALNSHIGSGRATSYEMRATMVSCWQESHALIVQWGKPARG